MTNIDDILCVCAYIRPHPPTSFKRRRGRVEGIDPPANGHERGWSTLNSLLLDIECLLEGVTNDGWWYLDDDMIIAYYRAHLEWIFLMRRIVIVVEYVSAVTQGDVQMDKHISNEEEDSDEDT